MESNNPPYKKIIEKSSKLKSIICTKQKIDQTKKEIVKVIEALLEKSVSDNELIDACRVLCQTDYLDVIEERSILMLCGYPICSNPLKKTRQIYHIVQAAQKVYDITERKKFCSSQCYTASNFLKSQIPDFPSWLREDDSSKIELFSKEKKSDVKLSHGNEIVMRLNEDEDSKPSIPNVQQASKLKEIKLKSSQEKDKQKHSKGLKNPTFLIDRQHSHHDFRVTFDSDDSSSEEKDHSDSELEHNVGEMQPITIPSPLVYSEKFMPHFTSGKRLVLINALPMKNAATTSNNKSVVLEFAFKILQEWMTLDSLTYLLGEDRIQWYKEKCLETESSQLYTKTESQGKEYDKLCSKLETMFFEDKQIEEKLLDNPDVNNEESESNCNTSTAEQKMESFLKGEIVVDSSGIQLEESKVSNARGQLKIPKRKKRSQKAKKAVDIVERKNKVLAEQEQENSEHVLPLVDSFSHNARRLQIVSSRLRVVYVDLLPHIGVSYQQISQEIRDFVSTFRYSSTNVTFKPNEWKLLALVILRILKSKFSFCEDYSQFVFLLKSVSACENITVAQIDEFISKLTDLDNLCKLNVPVI